MCVCVNRTLIWCCLASSMVLSAQQWASCSRCSLLWCSLCISAHKHNTGDADAPERAADVLPLRLNGAGRLGDHGSFYLAKQPIRHPQSLNSFILACTVCFKVFPEQCGALVPLFPLLMCSEPRPLIKPVDWTRAVLMRNVQLGKNKSTFKLLAQQLPLLVELRLQLLQSWLGLRQLQLQGLLQQRDLHEEKEENNQNRYKLRLEMQLENRKQASPVTEHDSFFLRRRLNY